MRNFLTQKWIGGPVFVLVFFLLLTGCANKKARQSEAFFRKWKIMAQEARATSPSERSRAVQLPEAKTQEPTAEEEPLRPVPERALPKQKVTLRMQNTSVPVRLRALARAADQNVMINADVNGKINISVKETPWDQVFRGILRTQGLVYAWEGDILRIMTVEDMEHDLKIEAVQGKRKAQELGLRRVEPLITRIIYIDYANAKDLKKNLEPFLTKDEEGNPRGSIMVDEHTNALIIQAIGDDIAKMLPIIDKLDRATHQVLIEANIVEASRDTARELGIQWGGLYHDRNYWITPGANTGGVLGNPLTPGINPSTGLAANFPADLGTAVPPVGLTLGVVSQKVGEHLLTLQLSALESAGQLNILSSPSITTLDNQKAIIESGAEVPYQSLDKEGNIDVKFKDAVLRLEVTPHVIDGRMLKLEIVTLKDEVDFTNTVLGNPTIITKKAQTTLILYDGQTTVIGGLTKQSLSESDAGIPGLKDIPLLGYLFKSEGKTDKMEEVLIFITPHVLDKEKGK